MNAPRPALGRRPPSAISGLGLALKGEGPNTITEVRVVGSRDFTGRPCAMSVKHALEVVERWNRDLEDPNVPYQVQHRTYTPAPWVAS